MAMINNKKNFSPFGAALEAASIAGGLIAGLGLATGSIAVAGVALVGTAVWFLAKNKKINPVLAAHGLTPDGQAFACGIRANEGPVLQKNNSRT